MSVAPVETNVSIPIFSHGVVEALQVIFYVARICDITAK
jgi:hypothetical protein